MVLRVTSGPGWRHIDRATIDPMDDAPDPSTPPRLGGTTHRPSRQTLAWYQFRRLLMIGMGLVVVLLVGAGLLIHRLSERGSGVVRPVVGAGEDAAVAGQVQTEEDLKRPAVRRSTRASPDWMPTGSYEAIRQQLETVVFGGKGKAEDALALAYISQELGLVVTARRALEQLGTGGLEPEDAAYREVFEGRQAVLEKRDEDAIAVALRVVRGLVRNRPEGRWLVAKAAELALEAEQFEVTLELTHGAGPEDSSSLHLSAVRALAATGKLSEAVTHLRRHAVAFPPVERALAQAEIMARHTDPIAFRDAWDEAYYRVLEEQRQEHIGRLLMQAWRAGERERLDLAVQTWEEELPRLALDDLSLSGMMLELVRHGATPSALVLAEVIGGRDETDWSRQHNVVYLRLMVKGAATELVDKAEALWRERPRDPMVAGTALLAATRSGRSELAAEIWSAYAGTEWARTAPGTRAIAAWCRLQAGHPEEARALVVGVMPEGMLREEAALLEEVWARLGG